LCEGREGYYVGVRGPGGGGGATVMSGCDS